MENVPLYDKANPEKSKSDKDDDKDEDNSGRRKARGAAKFAVNAEAKDKNGQVEKPENLWQKLKQKPEAVEPVPEEDAPADGSLGPEEEPAVVQALAEAYVEQIAEEGAEDLAAKYFYEEAAASGDIEEAAAQTYAQIEAVPENATAAEEHEPDKTEQPTETAEPKPEPEEEVVFERSPETPEYEDDLASVMPPPVAGGGRANPPRTPLGGPFGAGPIPPGGRPAIPTQSGNIYHGPITPDSPYVERYDQGNPAVTALIGGIIGYFIGRRRGRIRAEKQAAKVEKKLEKQIEDIQWQLKAKEQEVRQVAAAKVRTSGAVLIEKPVAARASAPEASQLHGSGKTHEKLAHMLLTSEAAGSRKQTPEVTALKLPERRVETLNRAELLALSEKIIVDGTTLRQIYETHLIGERGLRRLITEHLKGGDIKKILRHEIVEHEIDFERDPAMRDIAVTDEPAANAPVPTATKETLNKMLERASAGLGTGPEEAAAYYRARAAFEEHDKLQEQSRRRLVDVSLITVIALLVVAVLVLYFTRH